MMSEFFDLRLRSLQFVDLSVNCLESFGVIGPVIFAFSQLRDFLQCVLVDIYRHWPVHHLAGKRIAAYGHWGLTAHADADGVHFYTEWLSGFGCSDWLDFAGIVLAVAHENDQLAF